MSKKLYVGNLSYTVSDRDLEAMFAAHGVVESANVITDRDSGRSKGFGFVEMGTEQQARTAISAMHGKDFDGRGLTVNEARPRPERTGGGFGAERRF
jgi:RNA recognition motif-containing protein